MKIHKSAEDYLEMILMLKEEKVEVRSIDIAARLNVTKPSVSYAMKHLRENGYIEMDKDSLITLTAAGMQIAQKIYIRHKVIRQFLMQIGVNEADAHQQSHGDHDANLCPFRHSPALDVAFEIILI